MKNLTLVLCAVALIVVGVIVFSTSSYAVTSDYGWDRLDLPDPDDGTTYLYDQASSGWFWNNSSTGSNLQSINTARATLGAHLGVAGTQAYKPVSFTVCTTFGYTSTLGSSIVFADQFKDVPAIALGVKPTFYTTLTTYHVVVQTLTKESALVRCYGICTVAGANMIREAPSAEVTITAIVVGVK